MARKPQRFRLDPATVSWQSDGGSEDSWRAFHGYTLVHLPTGISVEKKVDGALAPRAKRRARERLWKDLWVELEDEVARYLGVSGWRRRAPADLDDIPPDPLT